MYLKRKINKPLGQLLIERGLLTTVQLEKALGLQREKGGLIGEVIISLGFVTEIEIAHALSLQYGFPYLPLENYGISPEALATIPRQVAEQYCLVPLDKVGNTLMVATADPLNSHAIEDIEYLSGCAVQIFVSTVSDIRNAISKYYAQS